MLFIDVDAVGDAARTLESVVGRYGVSHLPESVTAPAGLDVAIGELVDAYQRHGLNVSGAVDALAKHVGQSVLAVREADRFSLGGGA